MPELEITNMVMVQDPASGRVVVQRRVRNYCGISFPGGHAEPGEPLYDSAVREIREETGLQIRNLTACGLMYWYNTKTGDKYFIHLYRTSDYTGTLVPETEEGPVFWVHPDELPNLQLAPNFAELLPIFLAEKYTEGYCAWSDEMQADATKPNPWGVVYR